MRAVARVVLKLGLLAFVAWGGLQEIQGTPQTAHWLGSAGVDHSRTLGALILGVLMLGAIALVAGPERVKSWLGKTSSPVTSIEHHHHYQPPVPPSRGSAIARAAAGHSPRLRQRLVVDGASLEEAQALQPMADGLEERVWEARRRGVRVGFPIMPSDLVAEIRAWNGRVLALADKTLSTREAGKIRALPAMLSQFANAEALVQIIEDNVRFLDRLIAAGERQSRGPSDD